MQQLKVKRIKPLGDQIITTADIYMEEQYLPGSTIIDSSKTAKGLKEYQTVLFKGPHVHHVEVGDIVSINPSRYAQRKYQKNSLKSEMEEYDNAVVGYNFNMIEIDDKQCLCLTLADIDFVVEEYEMIDIKPMVQAEIAKKEIIL